MPHGWLKSGADIRFRSGSSKARRDFRPAGLFTFRWLYRLPLKIPISLDVALADDFSVAVD